MRCCSFVVQSCNYRVISEWFSVPAVLVAFGYGEMRMRFIPTSFYSRCSVSSWFIHLSRSVFFLGGVVALAVYSCCAMCDVRLVGRCLRIKHLHDSLLIMRRGNRSICKVLSSSLLRQCCPWSGRIFVFRVLWSL